MERVTAAQLWEDGDWLFATPTSGPVNPRTDYDEWKRLLKLGEGGRYQHLTNQVHRDIAQRVGGLLWDNLTEDPKAAP